MTRCKLSVNVNKIATIRNARGGHIPDLILAATRIESYGAHGITVHPRPDERHVRYDDVRELSKTVKTELNVEGYPSDDWMELVMSVKPTQATLVPDPPGVLTSNSGWDTIENQSYLSERISELKGAVAQLSSTIEERLGNFGSSIGNSISQQTQNTQKSLMEMHARLEVIDRAQENISSLSNQVSDLQNILSNKQLRGAFGEVQLENLVKDALP